MEHTETNLQKNLYNYLLNSADSWLLLILMILMLQCKK